MKVFSFFGFFVLVIGSLMLVSCSSNEGTRDVYDFRSGISEVRILEDSTFPREVSNFDPFVVRLIVQNRAAYDISNVKIGIAGLDSDKIKLDLTEQDVPEFFGRSLSYPEGDRREVVFSGAVARLKLAGDDGRRDKYQVYMNYDSIVELADDLCVSGASMIVSDGGCTVSDSPKGLSGQGAPLAITDVYSQAVGDRGQIRFTLENRGSGDAVYAVMNRATLGGVPISCQFLGPYPARFEFGSEDRADVSCSFDLQQSGRSYLSSLYVQIGYGYRAWEEHEVTIRRVGSGGGALDERLLS